MQTEQKSRSSIHLLQRLQQHSQITQQLVQHQLHLATLLHSRVQQQAVQLRISMLAHTDFQVHQPIQVLRVTAQQQAAHGHLQKQVHTAFA